MASIYQRGKKGFFWIEYKLNNKRIQYSLQTRDEKIARHLKKEKELEIEKGQATLPSTKRTKDFFNEYKEHIQIRKSKDTCNHEISRLTPFINSCPALLKDINAGTIQRFIASIAQREKGNKPRTVNHYLKHIKTFFNYAIECGYIYRNPTDNIRKLKETQELPRFLSKEELKRLILVSKNSDLYPMIMAALYTGMRVGELIRLQWQDIDFQKRTITIRKAKSKTFRVIPFSSRLKTVLGPLRKEKGVIFTYKGKPYSKEPKSAFLTLLDKAKIKNAGWHTFRKTFASYLAINNVSLLKISKWLGHSSPKLTYETYSHLIPEHDREIERLDF